MSMHNFGLTKLMEECGELIQIAAKKATFMHLIIHPDSPHMRISLQDEIADVRAAINFVIDKFDLDETYIEQRANNRFAQFGTA